LPAAVVYKTLCNRKVINQPDLNKPLDYWLSDFGRNLSIG
jgi:hypothetical protein